MDYDPFSPEVLAKPNDAYARLRAECPVHRFEGFDPPFYSLSRYADVADALRDLDTYSSHWGQGPHYTVPGGMQSDPPEHTMFRRMVLRAFTPRVVERMAEPVAQLADELIDAMVCGPPPGDLHDAFACPLPVITIARMLGVAEADRERFKVWSDAQVAAMGRGDREAQATSRAEMNAYLLAAIDERRQLVAANTELPDDLISGLVVASLDAPRQIDDGEMLGVLAQLLVGGNETTTSLITNMVLRLLQNRDLWEMLVTDPGLAEVAVEESLRFDAPVLGLFRTTTKPIECRGVAIPGGAKVMLLYGSADHDDDVFDDPETFRLDRDLTRLRRQHLAFGAGVHFCLGAPLARLEGRIALETLVRRLPTLDLAGAPGRIEPFLLYGQRPMPVRW